MIAQFLNAIFTFFQNLFKVMFGWISDLLGFLVTKFFEFFKLLFSPVLTLIAIIFYQLYKVAELVVTLLKVLLGIGMLFVSIIKGVFATLAGFSFTATPQNHGQWTSVFQHVSEGMSFFQLDNVAYVLMFMIWFFTAFAAMRILSSMRGGGTV